MLSPARTRSAPLRTDTRSCLSVRWYYVLWVMRYPVITLIPSVSLPEPDRLAVAFRFKRSAPPVGTGIGSAGLIAVGARTVMGGGWRIRSKPISTRPHWALQPLSVRVRCYAWSRIKHHVLADRRRLGESHRPKHQFGRFGLRHVERRIQQREPNHRWRLQLRCRWQSDLQRHEQLFL